MRNTFLSLLILMPILSNADARVRRVNVVGDQIVTVRTAIGIATIIQVPDRPNSVVVGDQDSFKVEYLDQAITIKPLVAGAKSNLYVYTDWRRYNVQLLSGAESQADYVVYLENPKEKTPAQKSLDTTWTIFKNSLKNEALTVETSRLGKSKSGFLLIEFTLRSNEKGKIQPEWFWITQNGVTRPIQNLFLSNLEVGGSNHVHGTIQLRSDDINAHVPIRLEVKRKRTSFLTIKNSGGWK